MTPPNQDARYRQALLAQARRNQEFPDIPMGIGQCGLRAGQVAIFPVRYALDESPPDNTSPQGPHPLPKNWQGTLPDLKTRSYTLRQLRDGWLYVWDSIDQTFHEYEVKGETFTRHIWTEDQLRRDVRHNPGQTLTYLLYPRRSRLRIAYSSVQWTWRMCEVMRSNIERQQWMRDVDLSAFCRQGSVEHGGLLTELGKSVADILESNAAESSAPAFTSTLLPTREVTHDKTMHGNKKPDWKPAFNEALVRGFVPDQYTALFIALDDPLGLADDLGMNVAGRLLERAAFEQAHDEQLASAKIVHSLCGADLQALIPDTLDDPLEKLACMDDLYTLLEVYDRRELARDIVAESERILVDLAASAPIKAAESDFTRKWKKLPDPAAMQKAVKQWRDTSVWRASVRFNEVRQYLSQTLAQGIRLDAHCKRSEEDLLLWLERMGPDAQDIFYDSGDAGQASQLMESALAHYTWLSNGETGQQWLYKQIKNPTTLFGMPLFNFNPEVAELIRKVVHNFSTHGTLDDLGRQPDGRSSALSATSISDQTNVATRANEIKSVLDLDSVRNSALYKNMSSAARQAMDTLAQIANDQARRAWHGLAGLLGGVMNRHTALILSTVQVLFSTEAAAQLQMVINPNYERDFQRWSRQLKILANQITGLQRTLQRPGPAHDHNAARRALQALDLEMKDWLLQQPNRISANALGGNRLGQERWQIETWARQLGQPDARIQQQLVGKPGHAERAYRWVQQNLGTALPIVVLGLNIWNLEHSATKARNDGHFTADEWRIVSANAAYTANALLSMWVGPAWSRAGAMSMQLGRETLRVAEAGYSRWLMQSRMAMAGSPQAAMASEFASLSKSLILRTVTWAAFGAIAAGLESWQLSKDIGKATSAEEKKWLQRKQYIAGAMSGLASFQLIGAALGHWFKFAWVMSSPVLIIVALVGIAYLIVSMIANHAKREGLRLWLHRCNWGREPDPQWLGKAGHDKQIVALQQTLQRPSVLGRALFYSGFDDTSVHALGFWLQIQVPSTLAGNLVTLEAMMVQTRTFAPSSQQATPMGFYRQFLKGYWIDPKQLGQLPALPGEFIKQSDHAYSETDQHRVWQVWINSNIVEPILEIAISYPLGTFKPEETPRYVFRIAPSRDGNEADRLGDAFSGQLQKEDAVVLPATGADRLELSVPLGVINEA